MIQNAFGLRSIRVRNGLVATGLTNFALTSEHIMSYAEDVELVSPVWRHRGRKPCRDAQSSGLGAGMVTFRGQA